MVNATENITLWKSRLQNLTDLQVPTDYPRPLPARTVEEVQSFDLSEQTLLSLAQFSMIPSRPTPFSVILAAFSVLLQRYTGDEEFAIGTSSPTGNPLLLRLNIDPASTLSNIIQMVTEVKHLKVNWVIKEIFFFFVLICIDGCFRLNKKL
jgi:L-aminoadipate-semialdehyde dehydrogenase